MLIVLSGQGDVECILEVMTNEYAIESFNFPSEDRFKRSDNIQEVARTIGLTKWNLIDRKSGYYVIVSVQVEKLGLTAFRLAVMDQDTDVIYFKWTFEYIAVLPPNYCFPIIEHPKRFALFLRGVSFD